MIVCEICGKKFKNAQGLRGHKTFVHGITGSKIPKTPAIAPTNEPQLSSLEERLKRLELIIISKDSLPDAITGAIEPLTQKLNNTTEQLAKISDTVSILNQDIRRNNTAIDTQEKDFNRLFTNLEKAHEKLAAAIDQRHSEFSQNLVALESRIEQTQKLVEIPGDPEPLTQKYNNTATQLAKLSGTVSILNRDVSRNNATTDAQKKEFNQVLTNLQESHNRLATLINEHRYSSNKNLEVLESRIERTQKLVETPGDPEPLTEKLSNTSEQLSKISDIVNRLGQDLRRGESTADVERKDINSKLTDTAEQLNKITNHLDKLDFITGIKGSNSDDLAGDTEPLTRKLNNTNEQLGKLSELFNSINQDIKRGETITNAQQKEFSRLLTSLQESHNKLAITITEHHDTFNKGLGTLESRIDQTQKMVEIPGDSEPLTHKLINTNERLNKLTDIIGKLEFVTGLKDTTANGSPVDSAPLSQRLNNTTEQLNKLEDTLNRLGQDVRLNETTTNAQRKEFSQLLNNLQEAHTRITAEMNGRDDTFDKNLEILESRIDETKKIVETQGNIGPLTEQLNNTTDQVAKLSDIVNRLSQDVNLSNTATDVQKKEFSNELNNTSAQLAKLTTRLDKLDFITGLKDSDSISAGSETLTQKLSNTNRQLKELYDIVGKLKHLTGLKDFDLEDTEPLTQKLNDTSAQLAKLGDTVDKLSQDIRLINSATDAQKEEASQLVSNLQEDFNQLAAMTSERHESFNKNLEALESRIENTERIVETKGDTEPLTQKLNNTAEQLDKLTGMVNRLHQDIGLNNTAIDAQKKDFNDRLSNTSGQLTKFGEILNRLEFIIGLTDSGPDGIPSDSEPLTRKLSNTAKQLNKLTDIVGKLSQDLKLNETATDAQKKEFSQLLTNLQEAHNRLATAINEHHYSLNTNMEVLESRIDQTQKMIEIPGDAEPLIQKVSNTAGQLNKLTDTVNKLNIGIDLNNIMADGQKKEFSAKLNSIGEELNKIGGTVNKLTSITGLGDTISGETPGSAESLTRKLSNVTDQLNKINKIVDKLTQDISLYDAITDGQRKEINNRFNNTSEELIKINGTINRLAALTGLGDSDSRDISGDTEPLTQKVKNTAEQLAKISDTVSRLSQEISVNTTATDNQKKEFGQLLTNLQEADTRLTAIVNEHHDTVNKNLEVLESRIDETQEMVEIPGDSESLPQKLVRVIEEISKLSNRLDRLDFITGLKDVDSTEAQGNIEPLYKKLSNTTEQLAKLGDIVNKLSLDIRLIGHTTNAQRKEISNRLTYSSEELVKISGIVSRLEFTIGLGDADLTDVSGGSESLTKKLSKAAEQLAKLSDMVNKLKFTTGLKDAGPDNTPEGIEPLTQRLTDTTGQLNKLTEMVGRLNQDIRQSDTTIDAQRKELSNKLSNTAEQLAKLTGRLDKLDFVTGLKDTIPNGMPAGTAPLTQKLNNTAEQLSELTEIVNKLTQDVSMSNVITDGQRKGFSNKLNNTNEQLVKLGDIVGKLSQDIRQSDTATDAQKKEFSQLLANLQEAHNRLAATIEEYHDSFNNDLELLKSRIENTQKLVEIPGDTEPLTQKLSNTNEQLVKISETVNRLEFVTGLRDADSTGIPGDAEPLTRKLNNTAEQLNKLTDMVSKLTQDVRSGESTTDAQRMEFSDRLNNTTEQLVKLNDVVGKLSHDIGESNTATDAQKKEFNQSLTNLQEAQSKLVTAIDEHRETIKKNLEVLESRLENTQKMVEGLSVTQHENKVKPVPEELDSLNLIPRLKTSLENVDKQIADLQAGVVKAQALAVRTPTDDLVIINMANGTKHTFRIYRGKRGLTKPHRVGVDPVHGEKYVDLAEPED